MQPSVGTGPYTGREWGASKAPCARPHPREAGTPEEGEGKVLESVSPKERPLELRRAALRRRCAPAENQSSSASAPPPPPPQVSCLIGAKGPCTFPLAFFPTAPLSGSLLPHPVSSLYLVSADMELPFPLEQRRDSALRHRPAHSPSSPITLPALQAASHCRPPSLCTAGWLLAPQGSPGGTGSPAQECHCAKGPTAAHGSVTPRPPDLQSPAFHFSSQGRN